MIPSGYIKLHRAALDSWLWTLPAEQLKVALTVLALANWKPGSTVSGGVRVDVPRGSVMTSLDALATRAGVSKKTVRTSLSNLERLGFLARTAAQRYTLISIVNYETYQDRDDDNGTTIGTRGAQEGHINGTRAAPIEEGKKGRREEEDHTPPAGVGGAVAPLVLSADVVQQDTPAYRQGEGYARELIAWLNAKRRELNPGIQGHGFAPTNAEALKAARRLHKAKVAPSEAIAALELRLASYRAISLEAARNNLTPTTMLNTKLSGFVEQHRAGHSYQASPARTWKPDEPVRKLKLITEFD